MKKYVFALDIVLGIALMMVIVCHVNGCTAEQAQSVNDAIGNATTTATAVAPAVVTTAAALTTVATSLGWPAWVLLVLNIITSAAGAIVASTKKTTESVTQ